MIGHWLEEQEVTECLSRVAVLTNRAGCEIKKCRLRLHYNLGRQLNPPKSISVFGPEQSLLQPEPSL